MKLPVALAGLLLLAATAQAETLTYKGNNKWVAPEDNAPLRALAAKARAGTTAFSVRLPEDNRALAITRLEIISDMLDKASPKGGIVLTETQGTAAANTLEVVAE